MSNYKYMKDSYKYINWRFVGNSNSTINWDDRKLSSYNSRHKRGIWILLDTYCHSCFIYGIDGREFLQISKNRDYYSFRDHYWDTPHIAYCKNCNGSGKFDWISRATGPQPFEKIKYKYIRDESKFLTFQHTDFLKDYIFAPTKIFRGERICEECMGTGIHIIKDHIKNLSLHNMNELQKGDINGNKMESS